MQGGSGQTGTFAGKESIKWFNSFVCVYLALSDQSCFICYGVLPFACEDSKIRL